LEQYFRHRASNATAYLSLSQNHTEQLMENLDLKPPAAPSVSHNHAAPASYNVDSQTRQLKDHPATTCGDNNHNSTASVADDSIVEIVQGTPDLDNTLYKPVFFI
jgi:hypothetical protein